jgi:uncharacterized protein YuzE
VRRDTPVQFDAEADALYVYLSDGPLVRTQIIDDGRMVDWAADGQVVGLEFLDVSHGIDLRGVPCAERVPDMLKAAGLAFELIV